MKITVLGKHINIQENDEINFAYLFCPCGCGRKEEQQSLCLIRKKKIIKKLD